MRGLAVIVWLAMPWGAAADGVRVRVWGATRIEAAGRETTDEAGAKWLEVRGLLRTELGEPVGGVAVRFERGGDERGAVTGSDGSFGIELRGGEGGWSAKFDGGERLRPSEAPVKARPASGAGGRPWIVFVPLLALGTALIAAGGVLLARRAGEVLRRLRAGWRRLVAKGPSAGAGSPAAGVAGAPVRRVRVVDALRHRALAGVRVEPFDGAQGRRVEPFDGAQGRRWSPSTGLRAGGGAAGGEGEVLGVSGVDGAIVLPASAGRVVLRLGGYVPREVGGERGEGGRDEVVRLLRGRDAVVGWLERARGGPSAGSGRGGDAGAGRLETVGQMALWVLGGAQKSRLEEVCYGRTRALDEEACAILSALHARAGSGGSGDAVVAGDAGVVIGVLGGEAGNPESETCG
ncbi:MAG: hypothetical protein HY905_05445 [Deltaproteobacteria bacterium]|nr:hypothetical protein [Deltaproteobacteria bacterium]